MILVLNCNLYSRNNITLVINTVNSNQDKSPSLTLGVSDSAKDDFDYNIEKDMPPLIGKEGIMSFFIIYDSVQQANVYSNIDLKNSKDSNVFEKTYHYFILRDSAREYTISWNSPPAQMVSALITDEYDGKFVNTDMKTKSSVLVNRYLQDVYIKIKYDMTKTDVEDRNEEINISPNPTNGILNIKLLDNQTIEILNQLGEKIEQYSNINQINIEHYPIGVYFLRYNLNNNIVIKKIVKI